MPYTGEEVDPDSDRARAGGPYFMRMYGGRGARHRILDAACRRSLGAYANGHMRGQGPPVNAAITQTTLQAADRFSDATEPGMLTVPRRLFVKGWRRYPAALLPLFREAGPTVYLMAKTRIPAGTEIIINYRDDNIFRTVHRTTPSPC